MMQSLNKSLSALALQSQVNIISNVQHVLLLCEFYSFTIDVFTGSISHSIHRGELPVPFAPDWQIWTEH
jgi:hypothetical protein